MPNLANPDWSRVDLLLLDMDGTLLDLHFDNAFWLDTVPALYAAERGMSERQARDLLAPQFEQIRGTLPWYSVAYWSQTLSLDLMEEKRAQAERIQILPGVLEFLDAMQARGIPMWLLTNAHPQVMQLKFAQTGLGRYFDALHSTHDYGFAKEDARFWANFAAAQPFNPSRSLMVDDSAPVLRAARDFGIGQLVHLRFPDSSREPNPPEDLPHCLRLANLSR